MFLNKISLKNFRCFEEIEIDLNKEYTVLVGVNGAGKSSVLDGISLALGSYIAGFDGISSNGIGQDDARLQMFELGSRMDGEAQYPVEIYADCNINEKKIEWTRSLQRPNGKTLITGAKKIMDYARKIQEEIRKGNKDIILPIIAYYGTGRLYMQKKQKKNQNQNTKFTRTSGYIDCLDSASNDKLMMRWFEHMTMIEIQEGEKIPELEAVKMAMARCYAGANNDKNNVKFEYKLKTHEIEITFDGCNGREKLSMKMLSDGLRSTISMVADIAYRMAVLNPQLLEHVLDETTGIVLIDEVDMHLHPEWQKRIMEDLHFIFPKVQFIVTTHAPSILANIQKEHILLFENYQVYKPINATYGRDISTILREMMKVEVRPDVITKLLDSFYHNLSVENYEEAKKELEKLEDILGDNDSDVVEAKISYDVEQI